MLEIKNVNKYFNKGKKNQIHVINNTSLEFAKNGLVAILGESGSGKTTLLNAIGGLDKVDSGNIYVNGQKITNISSRKIDEIRNLNIGYIFQDYRLIEDESVFDNISISLKLLGINEKQEIEEKVDYMLECVNMYKYKYRPVKMLSGGQRQRVAIARAIIKNPNIIIADEPTGNLDSKNSTEIMNILKEISKNKLVILVTHEEELAKLYASRIIEIKDGRIIKDYKNQEEESLNYEVEEYNEFNNEKNNYHSKFEIEKIANSKTKPKYKSIFGILNSISQGFKQISKYSILKKILMIGYFASAMFIIYSVSSIFGTQNIDEDEFIVRDKNYLQIETGQINVDDITDYEKKECIDYIIPGDSMVNFNMIFDDYLQTSTSKLKVTASLMSVDNIKNENIIFGRMPEKQYEVIIDKLVVDRINTIITDNSVSSDDTTISTELGIKSAKDVLGRKLEIENMPHFTIVGISNNHSQSIYTYQENFINIIDNTNREDSSYGIYFGNNKDESPEKLLDYNLLFDDIMIDEGRLPLNDYEVIVNTSRKEEMKLNEKIKTEVNGKQLEIVGFYESKTDRQNYIVNSNTIKYNLICSNNCFSIYANNKQEAINKLENDNRLNVVDIYEYDKENYVEKKKSNINTILMFSEIILAISLIEIFIMMRASLLSRIKEIGVLRSIGVKKKDIYIKFIGEIIAITTITGIPGAILMTYILNTLIKVPSLGIMYVMNFEVFMISILIIFGVNILFGILPLVSILKKTPASIISRDDI